jgi:Mycolic acid cyclopropane synthetase
MIEHVGSRNHAALFDTARRSLTEDGLFVLHTIGNNVRNTVLDRWTERDISPKANYRRSATSPARSKGVSPSRTSIIRRRLRPHADGVAPALRNGVAGVPWPVWRPILSDVALLFVVLRRHLPRPLQPALAGRALAARGCPAVIIGIQ